MVFAKPIASKPHLIVVFGVAHHVAGYAGVVGVGQSSLMGTYE